MVNLPNNSNPASSPTAEAAVKKAARKRRPMSVPTRRLEAEPVENYKLYWFREVNVPRAQQAGYEFVTQDESAINQRGIGNDTLMAGSSDLGSRVTVNHGGETMVLMKILLEYYNEDMQTRGDYNLEVMEQIFRNEKIMGTGADNPGDRDYMTVKESEIKRSDTPSGAGAKPLFQRPRR